MHVMEACVVEQNYSLPCS